MSQEHFVLRCFSCETFQVHIVKKSKKWECKMCGAKQSLKRNYGKGSGKDCRAQVMKLNELRMLKANTSNLIEDSLDDYVTPDTLSEHSNQREDFLDDDTVTPETLNELEPFKKVPQISKWCDYLDENESEENDNPEIELIEKKRKQTHKIIDNDRRKRICNMDPKPDNFSCATVDKLFYASNNETIKNSGKRTNDMNFVFDDFSLTKTKETNCGSKLQNSSAILDLQQKSFSKAKMSKYSKYLDEDDCEDNYNCVKKSSNVFDSDPVDLDNILNF